MAAAAAPLGPMRRLGWRNVSVTNGKRCPFTLLSSAFILQMLQPEMLQINLPTPPRGAHHVTLYSHSASKAIVSN